MIKEVSIIAGASLNYKNRIKIAEIIYDTFKDKIEPVLGSRDDSIRFLSTFLNPKRIILASVNREIVGVACLKYGGDSWLHIKGKDLFFYFLRKPMKFLNLILTGLLLTSKPEKDEVLLDILAVAAGYRGKGVGTALVNKVINLASSEKYKVVKLHIVDKNTRARRFYEKIGFRITGSRKVPPPLKRFYDFSKIYTMSYYISE